MPSGGARLRSGPARDPNALRRDRPSDDRSKDWVDLPADGFAGPIPEFPLSSASGSEVALWDELWSKPQAFMWDRLGLKFQVAHYVRTFLEASMPGAPSALKTPVLRMEGELGLSLPALTHLGWRFSVEPEHDAVVTQLRPVESDLAALLDDD